MGIRSGSIFTVLLTLPVSQEQVVRLPGVEHLQGLRALVVDAKIISRRILRELLQTAGLQVDFADPADAAIQKLREGHLAGQRIDLAIIDLDLPGLDGESLGGRIRALESGPGSPACSPHRACGERRRGWRPRASTPTW